MRSLIAFSLVILLTQIAPQTAAAQIANTWKGGTPGQETNWACSKNWSLGRIPDAFDNVSIPDITTSARKFPVIQSGLVEINQLDIQSNATLTIQGKVRILVNDFNCNGTCIGCNRGVWIEGSDATVIGNN